MKTVFSRNLRNVGRRFDALEEAVARVSLRTRVIAAVALAAVLSLISLYTFIVRPPSNFPEGAVVRIPEGATFGDILRILEDASVIRSPFALRLFVELSYGEENIRAGDYFFSAPRNLFDIGRRLIAGEFGVSPVRMRIPEGATRAEIAELFEQHGAFEYFSDEAFMAATEGKEGYLFPDTYFFLPTVEAVEVAQTMEETFLERVATLSKHIEASGHTLEDVVIMASLLEKEGRGLTMRQDIASVLWNRLEIGMLLQVDAVFLAINGKSTFDLTMSDLAMDSPHNTYKYKGLPPGPIANPGMDSLLAAVTPSDSEYLFYLSDMTGETHFAKNFNEHKANKRRYLD